MSRPRAGRCRWSGLRFARRGQGWVLAASLLVVAAAAGALAACGGSEFRWVTNGEQGTFFKVPHEWNYDVVTTDEKEGRAESMPGSITPVWHVYFDSATDDGARDPNELSADLVGNAQIFTLSNYYRETYSISQVREQLFHGVDPVYPPDDLSGRVELVSYRPIEEGGGFTGSRVVANINVAEQGEPRWLTVDGSLLFDDRTGRIFALTMECTSQCYLQNRSTADQIAASWKVNKT